MLNAVPKNATGHFHSERCYAVGPGDTEVLICGPERTMTRDENLCPECNGPMVSRVNRKTGERFWGCRAYPDCTGTRDGQGRSRAELRGDTHVSGFERAKDNDNRRWERE